MHFLDHIHQTMGRVAMIIADNGGAFKSNKLTEFMETPNITRLETIVYSPKTNGMVERVNMNIIERLPKTFNGYNNVCSKLLKNSIEAIRSIRNQNIGITSKEALYGIPGKTK